MQRDIHIPHDLMVEILKKLPRKSLVRFQSVSKLWSSTISMAIVTLSLIMCMAGERFANTKTAIFWDLKGCEIPDGENAVEVSQKIRASLKKLNYYGTTTIYAYGDTEKIEADLESSGYVVKQHTPPPAENTVEDYCGTASIYASGDTNQMNPEIIFNHVSDGDPERSSLRVLTDSLCWALDNPTPANLLLIVGSISEFRYAGYFLKLRACYNVLVAQPQNASGDVGPCAAADTTWLWESLSVGGDPIPNIHNPHLYA